jgi:hypothetical protein
MILAAAVVVAAAASATTSAKLLVVGAAADPKAVADLWDSKASAEACSEVKAALIMKNIKNLPGGAPPIEVRESDIPVCRAGKMGELTVGTALQRLSTSDACDDWLAVKVMSGKYEGLKGCLPSLRVGDGKPHAP